MNAPVLRASWLLVRRPSFLVMVLAAMALVAATVPVLDEGYGVRVLRGVAAILACALVLTTDDPAGEVLAASPYTRVVRTLARVLAGSAVVVPAWVLCAVVVERTAPDVPVLGLSLEALALGAAGLAIGVGLRAWRDHHEPAQVAVLGLVGLVLGVATLPRWYALHQDQTWGPPWEAAQLRWAAVLLMAAGVVALALRDPWAGAGSAEQHPPAGRTSPSSGS